MSYHLYLPAVRRIIVIFAVALTLLPSEVRAARVAVFDNALYVDTSSRTDTAESDNIQAALSWLGHRVSTFTALDADGIRRALSGSDVLVIPELERRALASALSEDALDAIRDYVTRGRELIVLGTSDVRATDLLNTLFSWTLTAGTVGNATIGPDAEGTAFAGAPDRILANQRTRGLDLQNLPDSAEILYINRTRAPVTQFVVGAGRVLYLGWDWYQGVPLGDQDGGWLKVLVAAIGDEAECRVDAESDLDRNGIADACENVEGCARITGRRSVPRGTWIELSGRRLRVYHELFLNAVFRLHVLTPFEQIDPTKSPLVLSVIGAKGQPRIAETLPTSTARAGRGVGWRFSERNAKWTYEDATGGSANGIVRVAIKDLSSDYPGFVRVRVFGEDGSYPVRPLRDVPPALSIVWGDAERGQCAEGDFSQGLCTIDKRERSMLCRY